MVLALALATAAGVIVVKVRGPGGKESEVTAPEGSKIAVDPQGKVTVTLPPDAPKPAPTPAFKPLNPAWLDRVAKLPADEQVKEVTAELVRRNPGFNEPLKVHKDDNGQVDQVWVVSTQLEDLSPFRGFPVLGSLAVTGKDWNKLGRVRDLSSLKGMHLWCLILSFNRVQDLSPLREMPLSDLFLECNPVHNLVPLQKTKMRRLGVNMTEVDDISPLRGMPLEYLSLHNTGVKDLSPLSAAPLKHIEVSAAEIDPLGNLPLEYVKLIGDYRPEQIKTIFRIPTMKELHVFGKYDPEQLKEFRGNPILKTINDKPAAEFWKAGDKAIPDKKEKTPNGNGS